MNLRICPWGNIHGKEVYLYTATTRNGMKCTISNYGGLIKSIALISEDNKELEVAYGFDSIESYREADYHPGGIIGRYANRIAGSEFTIDGHNHQLSCNEGSNQLHGGINGFDRKIWVPEIVEARDGVCTIQLFLHSPDGDEGFPGNLDVWLTYSITEDNQIAISYKAATDKPTHVNLTTHGYFNLSGFRKNVLDHLLHLSADHYLPVDECLIPTGELRNVSHTPFDFRTTKSIGADINRCGGFYDHCFALNNPMLDKPAAVLRNPDNGVCLKLFTTQPGLQLYTPINRPNVSNPAIPFPESGNWAVCLEPQHFPNTPNMPDFPTTLLMPNGEYSQTTIISFEQE
ncbi:MAG TPA: aldose epimerase family protein [Tenuifilaceae bacterium]|nr:aldose epimerase family protein [Tenuifilaceae bacterium]